MLRVLQFLRVFAFVAICSFVCCDLFVAICLLRFVCCDLFVAICLFFGILADTLFLHIFQKIRIVNFVSSRTLPEFFTGTARERDDTVFIIHTNLEMLQRRIIKFSVKITNIVLQNRYTVVVQSFKFRWRQNLPSENQKCVRYNQNPSMVIQIFF